MPMYEHISIVDKGISLLDKSISIVARRVARAAESAGDTEAAARYYSRLVAVAITGSENESLSHARRFFDGNGE